VIQLLNFRIGRIYFELNPSHIGYPEQLKSYCEKNNLLLLIELDNNFLYFYKKKPSEQLKNFYYDMVKPKHLEYLE
jgi:hypothetical protein